MDDPLVFTWSSGSAGFRETVVGAIEEIVPAASVFSEVRLEGQNDDEGFVTSITPSTHTSVDLEVTPTLTFTIELEGAVSATAARQHTYAIAVLHECCRRPRRTFGLFT